jgi:hypothetical protein
MKAGSRWKLSCLIKLTVQKRQYRRHPDEANCVSIVFENVDLAKLKATMDTAETNAVKAKDTAIDPIEIYIEVDRGK